MKALIDPTTSVNYVSAWRTTTTPYEPISATYPNSARVCQVEPNDAIFDVAEPYFWTDCADNVVADQFWYDTVNKVINPVVNAPKPNTSIGTQPA